MRILSIYRSSVFQDFESFLKTQIDWVEDDINLVLDEYNSNFFAYEITPGIYTFKDISEALFTILLSEYPGPNNEIDFEYDDIKMKTKLVVKYISQKFLNLGSTNKIHLKCDVIDGNVVNGLRQPILYTFVLDKKHGYKVFCESETILYKKINISVLNTITFYLEDDNNE